MITLHSFKEAFRTYRQDRLPFRLLQDQAAVMVGLCRAPFRPVADALDITGEDISWLLKQPEASQDYADLLGGNVYIPECADDLQQIVGMDMDWASTHGNQWPNVTDLPLAWDSCIYLAEKSGDPQWAMFLLCWNDAGGPVYYIGTHLWEAARVAEHVAETNDAWNP